ncbi:ATP-binding protein [Flavobacteriaceae bacterium]|jgi:signal transduction histidine kinase|nr:ATP-binding protein [Flavobacteriaceae bacterium]MDA9892382.1 ATP-binding protein [Flavobacteriaceae bacterium]MDB2340462.1 ATP-binding protein [Flavobacteriaceae bacterium]MDB2342984.1 ATP-binding protein [Flavobacteriaceae bacterium]
MKLFRILKNQRKNSGFLFAFIIVALILWNTNLLFQNLSKEQRTKMELWAMAQEEYIQNQSFSNLTFEVLQRSGINPMIQVDENDKILEIRNVNWDEAKQDSTALYKILDQIKKENDPILIQYKNDSGALMINQKLYYGNSEVLKKLQYYPLALLLIIFLFAAVLYFVFKTAKIAEQNRLWAAMAKETAHQIGTPLTSMMGWITLLKEKQKNSEPLLEIEKDIERLNVITDRFSKVGSNPELTLSDLNETISQTVNYLQKRSSEYVQFKLELPNNKITIPFNTQLISWTLENLIKNGIDAMKGKGTLCISVKELEQQVEILISDTGTGMTKEVTSKIFDPGFTTKSRGWGLGLSLARRIIVDFHQGKISVVKSTIGKGTQFKIMLLK